jgi:hypothetical protein
VSAVTAGGVLTVTWSYALQAAAGAIGNWWLRFNNQSRTIDSVNHVGGVTVIAHSPGGVDFGPNRCSYSPPPFLAVGSSGTPAAAFADFPVTV